VLPSETQRPHLTALPSVFTCRLGQQPVQQSPTQAKHQGCQALHQLGLKTHQEGHRDTHKPSLPTSGTDQAQGAPNSKAYFWENGNKTKPFNWSHLGNRAGVGWEGAAGVELGRRGRSCCPHLGIRPRLESCSQAVVDHDVPEPAVLGTVRSRGLLVTIIQ
jgi:hypothetical protein